MNRANPDPSSSLRRATVLTLALLASSGCDAVPADQSPDRTGSPNLAMLPVTLYPSNDLADQTGALTLAVNILTMGSARFTVDYRGETMLGEATRDPNDGRRGMAMVHGQHGMLVRCEYQMSSLRMGGTCAFSNGARYRLLVGN
jgi:hypothetical protein